jgi:similar to stage IV sporulation protein
MKGLLNFFLGYVVVRIDGPGVEKLLNLAIARGILFWDIHYAGDKAVFKTYPDNFPLLRPLSRKAGCFLKIEKKAGFPFLFYRFKKRRGLVLGLLVFLVFIYVVSNFIWFIEVKGLENIEEETVLKTAEKLGVTAGTLKRSLDFPSLERGFLLERRDLSWVGFQIQGTRLIIDVEEKAFFPEDFRDTTSDLVAARDGLVQKVLVLSGEARVEEGDTVQEGQILISGTLTQQEEIDGEIVAREVGLVRARGEVWARVWYEFLASYELTERIKERTGERAFFYTLRIKDREWVLGRVSSPYRNYEQETIKRRVKWRNLDTPIELVTIYYYEVNLLSKELSKDEALFKAKEELFVQAERTLPPDVEVVSHEVEELRILEDDTPRLRLMVETRENIVKEKEHEKKEENTD